MPPCRRRSSWADLSRSRHDAGRDGHWGYSEIDWGEFKRVLAGDGPCNRERLAARRKAHDEGAWVREAALAYAASAAARQPRRRRNREISDGHAEHAALGSLHSQPQRAGAQAFRLAACGRRDHGAAGRARHLHPPRRGPSIWVVPSNAITASDPADKDMMFEPTERRSTGTRRSTRCRTKSGICEFLPHPAERSEASHRAASNESLAAIASRRAHCALLRMTDCKQVNEV